MRKAKKKEISFGRVESEEISRYIQSEILCKERRRESMEGVKSDG